MSSAPIDKQVFWPALVVVVAAIVPLVVLPEESAAMLDRILGLITARLGFLFLWFTIGVFFVLLWFAFGRYGSIRFGGRELVGLPEAGMRALRGRRIAMIFQDPMMTLNPVLRIDTQMIEAITAHERVEAETARQRSRDALGMVGIPSPEERLKAYPHQFSGGMRQRVAIAIALLHHPDLIIADEPTTALDVTIQAQILYEVQRLVAEQNTAMIWITHDLSVIAGLADRVCVMYAGRIVEAGSVGDVIDRSMHPYTHGLIGSVPSRNPRGRPLSQIPGMAPTPSEMPAGCAFRPRCPRAGEPCLAEPPSVEPAPGRTLRCFNPVELEPAE